MHPNTRIERSEELARFSYIIPILKIRSNKISIFINPDKNSCKSSSIVRLQLRKPTSRILKEQRSLTANRSRMWTDKKYTKQILFKGGRTMVTSITMKSRAYAQGDILFYMRTHFWPFGVGGGRSYEEWSLGVVWLLMAVNLSCLIHSDGKCSRRGFASLCRRIKLNCCCCVYLFSRLL